MGGRRRGEGRTAKGETRTDYCRCGGGSSYRSSGSCGGHCLSETVKGAACPLMGWTSRAEGLNVGGGLGRLATAVLLPIRNWSLHSAAVNVVVGEGMAARLQAIGLPPEKIKVISNWADSALITPLPPEESALRKEWIQGNRFVVGYAGNLGRAHDIDTVLAAMALLQQRANKSPSDLAAKVVFVFVGGGAQRARLEREALKRGLSNFRLRPYQPKERLGETLAVADVHLVSLNPNLEGLIVPSKFYGIAAAGRPTIFIGAEHGEIGRLLKDNDCGFTVAPGDGEALTERILALAGDRDLCVSLGTRPRGLRAPVG